MLICEENNAEPLSKAKKNQHIRFNKFLCKFNYEEAIKQGGNWSLEFNFLF